MADGLFQKKLVLGIGCVCPSSNTSSTHFMATYLSEPQKTRRKGKRFDFRIKNFGKDKQTDCFPRFFP